MYNTPRLRDKNWREKSVSYTQAYRVMSTMHLAINMSYYPISDVIHKFTRDSYLKRFPELESLISDPLQYVCTVKVGCHKHSCYCDLQHFKGQFRSCYGRGKFSYSQYISYGHRGAVNKAPDL